MDTYFNYIIAFFASMFISLFIGPKFLPFLKKLKFGQEIREDGPKAHLAKAGTPTMGGFVFIIATIVVSAFYFVKYNKIWLPVLYMILFTIVGFVDDYIKVIKKRNLGMTAKQKIVMQVTFSVILSYIQLKVLGNDTSIIIPFLDYKLKLGWLYIPFTAIAIVATTNSTNLTDGLDGLCSSVTAIVMFAFGIIAYMTNNLSIAIFSFAVSGACLGFLRINKNPAKCFMGDTGSMALGGAVIGAAAGMQMTLFVIIIGFLYVFESLSVIIQVAYYKKTKKRFFKMAPFHHHLELCGLHETKIVKIFDIITCLLALIGICGAFIKISF